VLGAQAASAQVNSLELATNFNRRRVNIRRKGALGMALGMANGMTKLGFFATQITFQFSYSFDRRENLVYDAVTVLW